MGSERRRACVRLADVTEIRPAESAQPARWLLDSGVDWWTLVRYGPPGFDAYVRIAFTDPAHELDDEPPPSSIDTVRTALLTLVSHTTTPATGFAAVWEGWGGDPNPSAPRVEIPERTMLLFTGPIEALRDAPALAWHRPTTGIAQEPHLVWPADRAWCLACEVDEEIEFTVGCAHDAFTSLARDLPGAVRRVRHGEPAPMYREDQ